MNLLNNHALDDRWYTGKGLHKMKVLNPSQINGQVVGATVFEPIREYDNQNEQHKVDSRIAGILS